MLKQRKFLAVVLGLLVSFTLLLGVIRVVALVTIPQGGTACLQIDDPAKIVVDVRTGASHSSTNSPAQLVEERLSKESAPNAIWSPDGHYVALFSSYSNVLVWSVADSRFIQSVAYVPPNYSYSIAQAMKWNPASDGFIYYSQTTPTSDTSIYLYMLKSAAKVKLLDGIRSLSSEIFQWSADNRYMMLVEFDTSYRFTASIFSHEGQLLKSIEVASVGSVVATWTGHRVLYVSGKSESAGLSLMAYDVDMETTQTLVNQNLRADALNRYFAIHGNRILYLSGNIDEQVGLMDADGSNRTPINLAATSFEQIGWVGDYAIVRLRRSGTNIGGYWWLSPDGKEHQLPGSWIVGANVYDDGEKHILIVPDANAANTDFMLLNLETGELRDIFQPDSPDFAPALWSPDRSRVAVLLDTSLIVFDADGNHLNTINNINSQSYQPARMSWVSCY